MLRKNGYQITPVLEAVFKSKHFYDPKIVGQLIAKKLAAMSEESQNRR